MAIASSKRVREPPNAVEESLKTAFERSAVGMCLINADNHLIRVNHAFVTMLGYSKREILKKDIARITPSEDLEVRAAYTVGSVREGKSFTFEQRFTHKDGHAVWTAITASLVRCPDSDGPCFSIIFRTLVTPDL
jgi:PAS domain S-box-containing protein